MGFLLVESGQSLVPPFCSFPVCCRPKAGAQISGPAQLDVLHPWRGRKFIITNSSSVRRNINRNAVHLISERLKRSVFLLSDIIWLDRRFPHRSRQVHRLIQKKHGEAEEEYAFGGSPEYAFGGGP